MTYSMLIMTMLCLLWDTTSHAETGFDSKYERDCNIEKKASE